MKKKSIISIIVPIYNVDKYLNKCIESILNQTYTNLEIILIDDGSTDDSGKICDEYAEKDDRIIVIHKENGGVSSARNEGLKIATGKYLCFVDSDDEVKKEYIETLVNLISKNNIDIAMINYIRKYPDYETKNEYFIENKLLNKNQFFIHLFENNSYGGYLFNKIFIKEKILSNNVRFDENIHICEDLLFVCQVADKCEKFYYDFDEYLYYYYIRSDSALRSKYSARTATRVDIYDTILEILNTNGVDTIFVKRDYVYYALVARNELSSIDEALKRKYVSISKKYFKEIIKSKKILFEDKIKLIIMLYFPIMFKVSKKILKGLTNEKHKNQ